MFDEANAKGVEGNTWKKYTQETIGVRFDFDGEVTEADGVYNKFNVQPNAGKLPSTFKNWRDRNGGTHAIMTTALLEKDGATLPGPTWKQFCWRPLTQPEQDRVLMEVKRQAKLKRQKREKAQR